MHHRIATARSVLLLWTIAFLLIPREPSLASQIYTSAASGVQRAEIIVSGHVVSIDQKKYSRDTVDPFSHGTENKPLRKQYFDDATLEIASVIKGNPIMSARVGADGDTVRTVHLLIDAGIDMTGGSWAMSSEAARTAVGEDGLWFLRKGDFEGTYWWGYAEAKQELEIRQCLKTLESDYAGWESGFVTDEKTVVATAELNGFSPLTAVPQKDGSTIVLGRYRDELVLAGKHWFSSPTYDYFLAKLNPNGDVAWCKQVGCNQSGWVGLKGGVGNSVLLIGGMRESCSFLGQRVDCTPPCGQIILAVSAEGRVLWTRSVPGNIEDLWLQPDRGSYSIGGITGADVVFDGQPLQPKLGRDWFMGTLDANGKPGKLRVVALAGDQSSGSVQVRHDGSVLLASAVRRSQDGRNYDAVLCVLSPSGTVEWTDTLGGRWMDNVWSAAVGPYDEVVASISFTEDAVSPFVYGSTQETKLVEGKRKLKLCAWSRDGKRMWAVPGGGSAMAIDDAGTIYCAGSYGLYGLPEMPDNVLPPSRGDQDIYLASYDNTGALRWAARDGGLAQDMLSSLILLPNNRALLVGSCDAKSFVAGQVVNGSFVVNLPLIAPKNAR
jgi:hypothetical protein